MTEFAMHVIDLILSQLNIIIKETITSTDSDLQQLISEIKQSLPTNITTYEMAHNYVVRVLAINVGESILNETALLLPQVYSAFKAN